MRFGDSVVRAAVGNEDIRRIYASTTLPLFIHYYVFFSKICFFLCVALPSSPRVDRTKYHNFPFIAFTRSVLAHRRTATGMNGRNTKFVAVNSFFGFNLIFVYASDRACAPGPPPTKHSEIQKVKYNALESDGTWPRADWRLKWIKSTNRCTADDARTLWLTDQPNKLTISIVLNTFWMANWRWNFLHIHPFAFENSNGRAVTVGGGGSADRMAVMQPRFYENTI